VVKIISRVGYGALSWPFRDKGDPGARKESKKVLLRGCITDARASPLDAKLCALVTEEARSVKSIQHAGDSNVTVLVGMIGDGTSD